MSLLYDYGHQKRYFATNVVALYPDEGLGVNSPK